MIENLENTILQSNELEPSSLNFDSYQRIKQKYEQDDIISDEDRALFDNLDKTFKDFDEKIDTNDGVEKKIMEYIKLSRFRLSEAEAGELIELAENAENFDDIVRFFTLSFIGGCCPRETAEYFGNLAAREFEDPNSLSDEEKEKLNSFREQFPSLFIVPKWAKQEEPIENPDDSDSDDDERVMKEEIPDEKNDLASKAMRNWLMKSGSGGGNKFECSWDPQWDTYFMRFPGMNIDAEARGWNIYNDWIYLPKDPWMALSIFNYTKLLSRSGISSVKLYKEVDIRARSIRENNDFMMPENTFFSSEVMQYIEGL